MSLSPHALELEAARTALERHDAEAGRLGRLLADHKRKRPPLSAAVEDWLDVVCGRKPAPLPGLFGEPPPADVVPLGEEVVTLTGAVAAEVLAAAGEPPAPAPSDGWPAACAATGYAGPQLPCAGCGKPIPAGLPDGSRRCYPCRPAPVVAAGTPAPETAAADGWRSLSVGGLKLRKETAAKLKAVYLTTAGAVWDRIEGYTAGDPHGLTGAQEAEVRRAIGRASIRAGAAAASPPAPAATEVPLPIAPTRVPVADVAPPPGPARAAAADGTPLAAVPGLGSHVVTALESVGVLTVADLRGQLDAMAYTPEYGLRSLYRAAGLAASSADWDAPVLLPLVAGRPHTPPAAESGTDLADAIRRSAACRGEYVGAVGLTPEAVAAAVVSHDALDRARSGSGPATVRAVTVAGDPKRYVALAEDGQYGHTSWTLLPLYDPATFAAAFPGRPTRYAPAYRDDMTAEDRQEAYWGVLATVRGSSCVIGRRADARRVTTFDGAHPGIGPYHPDYQGPAEGSTPPARKRRGKAVPA